MPATETKPLASVLKNKEYVASSWDLTSRVKEVVSAGGKAITVVLKSAKFMSDDWLNFCGREYDPEENRPILRVQHAAVVTTTTKPATTTPSTTATGTTGQGMNGALGSVVVFGIVGAGVLVLALVIFTVRKRSL